MKKPAKKRKTLNIVLKVFILLTLLDICFYVFTLSIFNEKQINNQENIYTNTQKKLPNDVLSLESIDNLQKQYNNKDIIGLLYIPGTNIKEPIVQADDNDYYLKHDLYKNDNIEGAVFLDYRTQIDESFKNLIYSHNSLRYDVPFRELEGYYDKNYYENHKYIYLKSKRKIAKYKVFSIYVETDDWNYTKINFENKKEWFNHLKYLKEKSWYETKTSISKNDSILILQTCSNLEEYTNYDNKYLLIISKKIFD